MKAFLKKRLFTSVLALVMVLGMLSPAALAISLPSGTYDGIGTVEYHLTQKDAGAIAEYYGIDSEVTSVYLDLENYLETSEPLWWQPAAKVYSNSYSDVAGEADPSKIVSLDITFEDGTELSISPDYLRCWFHAYQIMEGPDGWLNYYELSLDPDNLPPLPEDPEETVYTYTIEYYYDNANGLPVPQAVLEANLEAAGDLPQDVTATPTDGRITLSIPESAVTTEKAKKNFDFGAYIFETLADKNHTSLNNKGKFENTVVDVAGNSNKVPKAIYKNQAEEPTDPTPQATASFRYATEGFKDAVAAPAGVAAPQSITEPVPDGKGFMLTVPGYGTGDIPEGYTFHGWYYQGIFCGEGERLVVSEDSEFLGYWTKAAEPVAETYKVIYRAAEGYTFAFTDGATVKEVTLEVGQVTNSFGAWLKETGSQKVVMSMLSDATGTKRGNPQVSATFPADEVISELDANGNAKPYRVTSNGQAFGFFTFPADTVVEILVSPYVDPQPPVTTHTVTYQWGEGTVPADAALPDSAMVDNGTAYTVSSALKQGDTFKQDNGTYTFSGWMLDGSVVTEVEKVDGDMTLTGSWAFKEDVQPPVEQKTTKVGIWHYYMDGINNENYHEDLAAEAELGKDGTVLRSYTGLTKEYVDSLDSLDFYNNENGRHVAYSGYAIWAYRDGSTTAVPVTLGADGYVDLTGVYDLRIHLEYRQTLYKVSYDANGGGDTDGKTLFSKSYNTAKEHTILNNGIENGPSFVRDGYEFAGWTKDRDGKEAVAIGETRAGLAKDETATYYAQWTKKQDPIPTTYRVTYVYSGDVPDGFTTPVDPASPYVHGAEVKLPDAPVAPANYTFGGWKLPEGMSAENGKFSMPEGDVVVTGGWTYSAPSGGGDSGPSYYRITVNYLEQGTGSKLAEPYTDRLVYGSGYDVSAQANKSIPGYAQAEVEGSLAGTLRSSVTINVYYTAEHDIPEEDTPLAPGPDNGGNTDNGEVEIPGEDTPLAPAPETGDNGGSESESVIVEEDVPMGNLPQTGTTAQDPTVTLGLLALIASLAAAGLSAGLLRKKSEEG